jgi:hypothetical protein
MSTAQAAADLVEGLGGPADHVERVEADDRLGGLVTDRSVDPLGPVGGDVGDLGGPLGAQSVEERFDRGNVTAGRSPDQPSGVVIGHRCQITMSLAMRDLVDPDPLHPVK